MGATVRVTMSRSERGPRRTEDEPKRNGRGNLGAAIAGVACPLCAEDLDALLADEQLPSELAGIFEEPARMVELSDGYEVELTEAEARALLTWATSHEIRDLESDLRQELAGFERRKRERGPKP